MEKKGSINERNRPFEKKEGPPAEKVLSLQIVYPKR